MDAPHNLPAHPAHTMSNLTTRTMNDSHSSEPLHGTVVDLFDQWAEKFPERVAAEWQGKSLTYGALRDASLHVSRALLRAGLLPRARAPLLTQMSLEMLSAVIGILRVGPCYVPMEVAAGSSARIEAALSELASPVVVITSPCPGLQLPTITIRLRNMDRSSSFTRLGGNSLAAIQVSKFLKQRGYSIPAAQVLRLDTIERLEDRLRSQSNIEVAEGGSRNLQATATPVQRLFLKWSIETPHTFAIIGLTKYIGDSSRTPTASDLRGAMEKSLSAHSIFRTRSDLTGSTLSDLSRHNLTWGEVSVSEDELEQACAAAEEESWQALYTSQPRTGNAMFHQDARVPTGLVRSATPGRERTSPPEALNLIRLQSSPTITRAALDASSRRLSVTPSTMIYAAWALFLHSITSWVHVCFSVSLSGSTVPWPSAPSVVGPLLCRSLFSTSIVKDATAHDWLATVHKTTLDIIEFDGLTHSLPPSLMADPRTNTSNVLYFLDVPAPSQNWSHKDR
ncbi:NRPS-like enzyme [Aspergillus fumigatus Z5]|nr:NRPS-like enzyme [Aspergillus fumigatus Z5]